MSRARASILVAALLASSLAHAQGPSEGALKAAFLVKFGAYVGWPAAAGPMTLCVVGRDPLGGALDEAASGQRIAGRPVTTRRLESVTRASGCDLVYLTGSAQQSVPAALATLKGAPVLTVTDSRWSNARGMIHFQVAQNRVRFHIDDRAAGESGLAISSRLLGLALTVRQRAGR